MYKPYRERKKNYYDPMKAKLCTCKTYPNGDQNDKILCQYTSNNACFSLYSDGSCAPSANPCHNLKAWI